MPIFLDTADLKEIKRFHRMGIIRGVTTNPTILLNQGFKGGMRELEARAQEIASLIAPLPLSVEVTTNEPARMVEQARTFSAWAENIAVKITVHGPEGELDGAAVLEGGREARRVAEEARRGRRCR